MERWANGCILIVVLTLLVAITGCFSATPDASPPQPVATDTTSAPEAGSLVPAATPPPPPPAETAPSEISNGDPADAEVSKAPSSSRAVVDRVDNAVVYITTQDALGEDTGVGSGCVISKDGLVATNFHVMASAATAYVQLVDGTRFDVVGYRAIDRRHDLVILQLDDNASELEVFELKQPEALEQGDNVMAIGHPSGFRFTVTTGIVSAVRGAEELPEQYKQVLRLADDTVWIQTNAAISGGNSGGPLLNVSGELVGLNTWVAMGQNLGFAIHVRHLIELHGNLESEPTALPLPETDVISDPRVARLVADYRKEYQVLLQNIAAALTVERKQSIAQQQNPAAIYVEKLVELSDEVAGEPAASEALAWACRVAATSQRPAGFEDVMERLNKMDPDAPQMRQIASALALLQGNKEAVDFLRKLRQTSKDRELRGVANLCLAGAMARLDIDQYRPEIVETLQIVMKDYADVELQGMPLSESSESQSFAYKHLAVGTRGANIRGEDFAGEPFELEEYRGKVVVLDFWADWCPHCRVMYPHERELITKHADQPFALLGVNGDERERAQRVIGDGTVTWRSWVDGTDGEIAKQWQIASWPSIFVLDRRGVIRYRDVRGEELDQAIEHLLNEPKLDMPGDLVAAGAEWKYSDDGSDQGTAWRAVDFDDSSWSVGAAPLGYGLDTEVTRLNRGDDPDAKPITYYFRHSFEIADAAKVSRAILGIIADDGMAVYLNGKEVARRRLTADAAHETVAFGEGKNGQGTPELAVLPSGSLKNGRNVLAVEVHQVSASSADLYFDLTLSSNFPAIAPVLETDLAMFKIGLCRLLGQLGPSIGEEEQAALKKLIEDKDQVIRYDALIAGLVANPREIVGKVPEAKDESEKAFRLAWANALNGGSWDIAAKPNRSQGQYDRAVRMAIAACALTPDNGAARNTLAVAQYRARQYERSLKTLKRSLQMQGMNPFDLSFVVMAHHQVGNADKAKLAFTRLREVIKDEKWSDNEEAREFFEEAAALLGEAR